VKKAIISNEEKLIKSSRGENLEELKKGRDKPPKMVAVRSDHYNNLVGSVDLFTYFKKEQYKVEWCYKEKVKVKSKYNGKIREFWRSDEKTREIELFSDSKKAVSQFKEIFEILRDKEEKVKRDIYKQRVRKDKEQKLSRMVEIKDMNLRVLHCIKDFMQSSCCLNCGRDKIIFKIDEDTGEFTGYCQTCSYRNTLPNLLLKEKELLTNYEQRIQLKEAGMKKCPFCGEIVKIDSIKCNYCNGDLNI